MKKLITMTLASLILVIGCSEKELVDTTEEVKEETFNEKSKTSLEVELPQKVTKVFNEILKLEGVNYDLSRIVEKNASKLSDVNFKGYIFEDHIMMKTDYVFEDNIMMLTNNSFQEEHFEIPNNEVIEDNIIFRVSPNTSENSTGNLIEDFVTEDHVILRVKTIKDDVLPSANITISENLYPRDKTFENIFNTIYETLYPEDKVSLKDILYVYPNLFVSTSQSYFSSQNNMNFPLSNLATLSTQTCNGGNGNPNEVKLTLIKEGENVMNNYYYRNNISSIALETTSGVLKAVYNGSGGNGNLVLDSSNNFFTYTSNTPISTTERYNLIIYYSNNTSNLGGYFSITTTNAPSIQMFMHYETKENLDYSVDRIHQYLHPVNSNPHRVTQVFHGNNEPVTLNTWLSKGISRYNLTLTEVSTGITETITGLDVSKEDFAVDLRNKFNMYIGTSNTPQYVRNEYRLTMNAVDCNNFPVSKTITFYIDSRIRQNP
jgi:hypothetical protein